LKELPSGVLKWGSDVVEPLEGYATLYVDVVVPEVQEKINTRYLFQIFNPDDLDGCLEGVYSSSGEEIVAFENLTMIGLVHSNTIFTLYDSVSETFKGPCLVRPYDIDGLDAEIAELYTMLEEGTEINVLSAYTVEEITTLLNQFMLKHTGRTDLVFEYDAGINSAHLLGTSSEPGHVPGDIDLESCIDMGDGLYITSESFDALVASGLENAAETIAKIKEEVL
jgi:hypothetical protein